MTVQIFQILVGWKDSKAMQFIFRLEIVSFNSNFYIFVHFQMLLRRDIQKLLTQIWYLFF